MDRLPRTIAISALVLSAFALTGALLVALIDDSTREAARANEQAYLLRLLNDVVPVNEYDNDLYADRIRVHDAQHLGTDAAVLVYRARRRGEPLAVLLTPVAPDGYNGDIRLLVGIQVDGTVSGVRVIAHRETPGLGDGIEVERSDWIHQFAGTSLDAPAVTGWRVRKDGGEFDQFTGATITPRAIVAAVHAALRYVDAHRDTLFALPANSVWRGDQGETGKLSGENAGLGDAVR